MDAVKAKELMSLQQEVLAHFQDITADPDEQRVFYNAQGNVRRYHVVETDIYGLTKIEEEEEEENVDKIWPESLDETGK